MDYVTAVTHVQMLHVYLICLEYKVYFWLHIITTTTKKNYNQTLGIKKKKGESTEVKLILQRLRPQASFVTGSDKLGI